MKTLAKIIFILFFSEIPIGGIALLMYLDQEVDTGSYLAAFICTNIMVVAVLLLVVVMVGVVKLYK